MKRFNYKLTLSYDGTLYSGWQIQPNAPSIQEKLQNLLALLTKQPKVVLIGSGRTDAGVHALGQVAHFKVDQELDCHRLLHSLNGLLPPDIRVKTLELVPDAFHAQQSAIGKEYHYHLHLDRVMNPFKRLYAWHIVHKIDVELMREATQLFVGTHDFTSFANEPSAGAVARNPVRTIHRLDLIEEEGGIRLEFYGNGFLYKMVRNIVGTLLQVAAYKLFLYDIEAIFAARDRRRAAAAAAPQGLFLVRVDYPLISLKDLG